MGLVVECDRGPVYSQKDVTPNGGCAIEQGQGCSTSFGEPLPKRKGDTNTHVELELKEGMGLIIASTMVLFWLKGCKISRGATCQDEEKWSQIDFLGPRCKLDDPLNQQA